MTAKTKVAGFLEWLPGDDERTYLWRWLGANWRVTDALFDPVTGHKHDGTGASGGPVSGSGGAGLPINWRGTWSGATSYAANDGVNYQGSSYVATAPVTGTAPPAAPWQLVAAQGATGPTGATGATGSPGAPGSVWYTGSGVPGSGLGVQGDYYLNSANGDYYSKTSSTVWTLQGNIRGPQGATGAQGIQGVPGPVGLTWRGTWSSANSYAVNDAVFYGATGSSYICTLAVGSGGGSPNTDPTHWSLLASGATGTWGSP